MYMFFGVFYYFVFSKEKTLKTKKNNYIIKKTKNVTKIKGKYYKICGRVVAFNVLLK